MKALLEKKDEQTIEMLSSTISSFEWLANVHELFNATLMDTALLIKYHNIDRYVYIFILQTASYFY